MHKRDSFELMATGISDEERMSILDQMRSSEIQEAPAFHPIDEKIDLSTDPLEIKLKKEPFMLRFYVWLKSILTNTTPTAIYNEHRLNELARYVQKNFPGVINHKQNLLLSPFYEHLTELKACADFFKPYILSLEEDDGSFYAFLSTFVMPDVTEDIKTNVDPYSNPVTPHIKPDTRSNLLKKLDEIFDNIPADSKALMYRTAQATEWLKQFTKLPFARVITQFSTVGILPYTCTYGMVESEVDTFSRVFSGAMEISDEFLEALYMFAIRNSNHGNEEETGRDAGEFLNKAHSSLGLLMMFMNTIPIRSLGCLIHADSQWQITPFSGGEDWFVKFKNTWKRLFDQKWAAWESDCKKEAMLSSLKVNFGLEFFPHFPERPWANLWDSGVPFAYESTLGFLNWFMREKFSICELDLKTLLVQGSFNKKENYNMLAESFGAMIQLSISFQELERKLSPHGETGAMFNKITEERSRTLQAQSKVDQMMREVESDVISLIRRFCDSSRSILWILAGILGLTKDSRYDTISNLNKMKDKNNKPFVDKIEQSKNIMENALNFVMELETLDKQKRR